MTLVLLAIGTIVPFGQAQTAHFLGVASTLGSGFSGPRDVAVDSSGNVYVADFRNKAVKKIPYSGGSYGTPVTLGSGFNYPNSVAVDGSGNVYVADTYNSAVKKIPYSGGSYGTPVELGSGFSYPYGVAVDGSGNVYVADSQNNAIKKIPYSGGSYGTPVTLASGFNFPQGVGVDGTGNVYVSDSSNEVYQISYSGGSYGTPVEIASGFNGPGGIGLDGSGNVYVADIDANVVKKIPYNGTSYGRPVTLGSNFSFPYGVAVDASGNAYVADQGNNRVQKVELTVNFGATNVGATAASQTLPFSIDTAGTIGVPAVLTQGATGLDFTDAGTGSCTTNGVSHSYSVDSICTVVVKFAPKHPGPRYGGVTLTSPSAITAANPKGTLANAFLTGTGNGPQVIFNAPLTRGPLGGGLSEPDGVTVDGSGNVYVANFGGNTVQMMANTCASSSCVTTLGGGFGWPAGLAVDGIGNVYVADSKNSAVKVMANTCTSSSCVTTLGGGFNYPAGVAVDGSGNVYVADDRNSAVKVMANTCTSSSCVTTLGGGFNHPEGVAVDGSGNVYETDGNTNAVKMMANTCASSSCVTTLGGGFAAPIGVAVDGTGNVYVADPFNGAVTEMANTCTSSSCVTRLGNGFANPAGVAVDGSGNVYVADTMHSTADELARATPPTVAFATTTADGSTDSTDGTKTVTLQNGGNQPLVFAIPTAAGNTNPTTAPDFTFTTTSSSACPQLTTSTQSTAMLAAGATCNVPLTFTPVAPDSGALTESVVFTDTNLNASAATQTITLTGTAKLPVPTVTSISPNSGPATGGSSVTINGTNFTSNSTVAFGSTAATSVVVTSTTSITVSSPPGIGTVDVTVTTGGSTSSTSASDLFTYVVPVSTANSTVVASPSPAVAGSAVTVTVTLQDAGGNALHGATASFSSTSTTASFGTPNVSGNVITVSMTDTAAETAPISVTLGGATTGTLSGSAQFVAPVYVVTVTTDPTSANESASHCVDPNVSTTGNANCSLREAVDAANALPGVTTNINFATPSFSSAQTILIAQSTPITINTSMNINGPGANLLTVEGGTTPLSTRSYQVFFQNSGTVTLSGLTVANGFSITGGGGIAVFAGTLTVSNSTFSGNSVSGNGNGGAIATTSAPLTVSNSTFSGNSSLDDCGAIYAFSTLAVSNSTFSGNSTASDGGAICAFSTLTVNNSTFAGNSASGAGGAIAANSTLTVTNSIFSGDSAGVGSGLYAPNGGTVTNSIYNGDNFSGVTLANVINADPKLSALGSYGGPTQTFLPLPGSPAICAGTQPSVNNTPLATDQRGVAISGTRYGQTACYDIGAVQTSYTLTGPLTVPSPVTPGTAVSPAPTVTLNEDGSPFTAGAATVTLTDTDNDLSSGASATNSLTTGVVTFNGLQFSMAEASDQLTATLSLNPATPVSLTLPSNTFQVSQLTPVLAFTPVPSSQAYGTGIAASSLDATATYNSNTVAGTFSYTATSTTTQAVTALTPGTTVLPADTYTLTATFTPTDTTVYKSGLTVTALYNVTLAAQTINFTTAPPATATYGTQFTVAARGGGSGSALVYASGGGCSNVGATYTMTSGTTACTVTVSQAGNANYLAATSLVATVSANLATPTVTLMTSLSAVLTQNPVTLTATVASTVSTPTGSVTFFDGTVPLATVPLNAGVASLTTNLLVIGTQSITAVYSGDHNFLSLTSAPSSVLVSDFSLTPVTTSQTILPGGTATYNFTVSPLGATVLPAAITLSVSGLPTGATYSFNPSSTIASGSGATSFSLTIKVPQQKAMLHRPSRLLPYSLAALLLLPFVGRLRQRARKFSRGGATLLLLAVTAVGMTMLSGCGSENGFLSQPQQSSTVTVTATGGALTHSATVTLTVE